MKVTGLLLLKVYTFVLKNKRKLILNHMTILRLCTAIEFGCYAMEI